MLYVLQNPQRHQHQSNFTLGAEWKWRITDAVTAKLHYTRFKSAIDVTPQPCTWRDDLRFKQCKEGQSEGKAKGKGSGGEGAWFVGTLRRREGSSKSTRRRKAKMRAKAMSASASACRITTWEILTFLVRAQGSPCAVLGLWGTAKV